MITRRYKAPRHDPRRDSDYLRWVRMLPCVVCFVWKLPHLRHFGSIEAAHVGERGLGQKCPDNQVLPLCCWHHRTGPHAVHVLGRKFWTYWKLDRYALIAEHQLRFERRNEDAAA